MLALGITLTAATLAVVGGYSMGCALTLLRFEGQMKPGAK